MVRSNKSSRNYLNHQQETKSFQINDIIYIDYYSEMVGDNRGLKKYTTDGVHLNKMGYDVMCEVVKKVLKKEGIAI